MSMNKKETLCVLDVRLEFACVDNGANCLEKGEHEGNQLNRNLGRRNYGFSSSAV